MASADSCIFCQIVLGRAPSNIVYEDSRHIAFLDAFPFARGHTLVCPKEHGETIWDMDEAAVADLFKVASRVSRAVVRAINADGFRFVQNNGKAADQAVAHVHIHVIPVKMVDKGGTMGRKTFTAEEMRQVALSIRSEMK